MHLKMQTKFVTCPMHYFRTGIFSTLASALFLGHSVWLGCLIQFKPIVFVSVMVSQWIWCEPNIWPKKRQSVKKCLWNENVPIVLNPIGFICLLKWKWKSSSHKDFDKIIIDIYIWSIALFVYFVMNGIECVFCVLWNFISVESLANGELLVQKWLNEFLI